MGRGVRIGRRVVKGRFIVFLLIAAACLIWAVVPKGGGGGQTAPAAEGSLEMVAAGPSVCIWPEEVYSAPEGQRVNYHVADGQRVENGQIVADIFPPQSDSGVLDELYALQEEISRYQISILSAEQSRELDSLNEEIALAAAAVQSAALEKDVSAVAEGENQLNTLMGQRQQWLDEHADPDEHLLGLYDQEADLIQELAEETIPMIAPVDGYVSFAVDGLEGRITPDLVDYITLADMDEWLSQTASPTGFPVPAGDQPFFKIIFDQPWYLAVKLQSAVGLYTGDTVTLRWNDEAEENPAQVVRIAEGKDASVVILKPEDAPVRPRLGYVRIVKAASGIKVPAAALYRENGRDYIRIEYRETGRPAAIEVRVEALDRTDAIVSAVGDIAGLAPGVNVYIHR